MNFSEIAQLSATVASALAAVLAWVAKLRWSKEYAAAKEEIIKSKEAQLTIKDEQIRMLRTLIESKDEAINARNAENSVLCREINGLREAAYPVDSGSSICSGVGGSAPLRGLSRFMMSQ